MPSIHATDWLALKGRIDTLVTDPVMPRLEPGAIVTPPSDATGLSPYLLLSDVTNPPDRVGIDPRLHIRSGTLMLAIQWPISRAVEHTRLKEIGGQIAGHFPADQCMAFGPSRLRVTRDADVMQPFVDGTVRVCVVRVAWASV